MRVALIAESFLPSTNGVTNSLLRVIEHLSERGDDILVIAPEAPGGAGPERYHAARITRVAAVGWPGYRDVRVSIAGLARLTRILDDFDPDVAHLASPFVLGWTALKACQELGIPTVAIYQTEVPSYADRYHAGWGEPLLWNRVRNIHDRADLTLAPSTYACTQLEHLGVERVKIWPRGVDTRRFHPSKRDDSLHRRLAPGGEVVVGYVGRLASEKRVHDLARLSTLPHTRIVIVGDGPMRAELGTLLPDATFTGHLAGEELARTLASLDIFVHTGELETFCQTIQEAHASGVPVIAPRRGGPIDLVTHDATGYLYSPGDLDAMAAYVELLVTDRDRRERFGLAARVGVESRTWNHVCAALVGHYADVIHASTDRPVRAWDVLEHEVVIA